LHTPYDIDALIPLFNQYPLAALTIHSRTADQGYGGNVDIDRFEKCLEQLTVPVVYNGDINTLADYRCIRDRFGSRIAGVMIGRGLIADPFLAEEILGIAPIRGPERSERFWEFHDELVKRFVCRPAGRTFVLGRIKELWTYWKNPLMLPIETVRKIRKTADLAEYAGIVGEIRLQDR